ncbi:MAG: formyltransferase family protein [Pseudomonadota bacterium]
MSKRRIILFTRRAEAPDFVAWLREHAAETEVDWAEDLAELRRAVSGGAERTRLISYLSGDIVPADVLARLGLEPYNIHPGPPEYPGSHPDSFALYEGARRFGVTAHVMAERVDSGPIVCVERFQIPEGVGRLEFGDVVVEHASRVFARVALFCAAQDAPIARVTAKWSQRKRTKKEFAALCREPLGATDAEVRRRKRACGPSWTGEMATGAYA